jgi:hypothetical protein
MKKDFSKKYKDYVRYEKQEMKFFRMIQRVDETLEDYAERFQCSYKWGTNCKLEYKSLKLVLIQGVREDLMEYLDLIATKGLSVHLC